MEAQGLLILRGKRIVSHKLVRPYQGSYDWVKNWYERNQGRSYALVSPEIQQKIKGPFYYYDGETVKPMKKIKATVDKPFIESDGLDTVVVSIKTNETMEILIQQQIGVYRDQIIIEREPIDGKIEVSINSDGIGTIRIQATGETVYTGTVEIEVR